MKLRVRALESKETLKIETPSPCSLQDLKNAVAEKISSLPETLHLSLNRKDEIPESSPEESLQSLGITSGDLIFYTLNPNGFSGGTSTVTQQTQAGEDRQFQASDKLSDPESETRKQPNDSDPLTRSLSSEGTSSAVSLNPPQEEPIGISENADENMNEMEEMDVDVIDEATPEILTNSSSVPCFMKKVFKEEAGNAGSNSKLLIIAVHAVLLESGFVCFDSATNQKIAGFSLPQGWASRACTVSVKYTVPDLFGSGGEVVEAVVLKFQNLGKLVHVYGSLGKKGSDIYALSLDESLFMPSINFVWTNCDSLAAVTDKDEYDVKSTHEKKVFEFWKMVKDRLTLPLLVDLCEKTGLVSPPCFMLLPTELKIQILDFLPGADTAKIGCVCSELRYLSSNDDLWKHKFAKEFGFSAAEGIGGSWKKKFASLSEKKKMRKRRMGTMRPTRLGPYPFGDPYFLIRDPAILGPFGGRSDVLPGGVDFPYGLAAPRLIGRRHVGTRCNLGGFNI
ncbi:F-box protein SKIP22-like [Telopea speciosissima]|uniref:F-box protein SKIP22-like n=1 Tax=Telopea speciosissima TaxID=54955 RepID=UPI001CC49635|nr:F-box protein SKIP22-like [Telopea speciosissima]XP_043711448.1 F-box protein SKIP22-like [Telopea speciosissima]XP_043711449.1 F-box protein SKIP22-like [Telopea speciosissima]